MPRLYFLGLLIFSAYFSQLNAAAIRGRVYLHKATDYPEENPYVKNQFRTDLRFTKWHLQRRFETARLKNYDDPTDAIIYLSSIPEAYQMQATPNQEPVIMQIEKAKFKPRTLPVMQGTAIEFVNKDPVYHDVYSFSAAHAFHTPFFKEFNAITTFKKPGGITIQSSVYKDMNAQILVLDHPWFTKPRETGYYHIRNIRPGIYKVTVWHPDFPPITQDLEINYSETITIDFHLSVEDLPETILKR